MYKLPSFKLPAGTVMGGVTTVSLVITVALLLILSVVDYVLSPLTVITFSPHPFSGVATNSVPFQIRADFIGLDASQCTGTISMASLQCADFASTVLMAGASDSAQYCSAQWQCFGIGFSNDPTLTISIPRATAHAAAIRVEVSVPHFTPGEVFIYRTQFVPPTPIRTVFKGNPKTSLQLGVVTTVSQRSDDPTSSAETDPTGFQIQFTGLVTGATATADTFNTDSSSGSGTGLVISLQPTPLALFVREKPTQTPLNLVAQMIALSSGALTVAVIALQIANFVLDRCGYRGGGVPSKTPASASVELPSSAA